MMIIICIKTSDYFSCRSTTDENLIMEFTSTPANVVYVNELLFLKKMKARSHEELGAGTERVWLVTWYTTCEPGRLPSPVETNILSVFTPGRKKERASTSHPPDRWAPPSSTRSKPRRSRLLSGARGLKRVQAKDARHRWGQRRGTGATSTSHRTASMLVLASRRTRSMTPRSHLYIHSALE